MEVCAVRTRSELAEFIGFPYNLHRGSPFWVPPLIGEQKRLLNRKEHPFFDFGSVELFLARHDGRTVGRIAAVDNPNFNDFHGTQDGFFGLFECVDSPDVARGLFGAVRDWLGKRQLTTLSGPVNFSTNYECGMLTEGFDRLPAIDMVYNPPYYPDLMAECGLDTAMELLAWEVPVPFHDSARTQRLVQMIRSRINVRVRPVDLSAFGEETARIKDIYNSAWERNWGFSPMTDREFGALAKRLRQLIRSELCLIVEVDEEPVAFAVALPDISAALAAAKGRLHMWGFPLGLVRLMRAQRRSDRLRLVTMGIRKEFRGRGIAPLLLDELSKAASDLGYSEMEFSWVLATNDDANQGIKAILDGRAEIAKKYHIYRGPVLSETSISSEELV